MYPYLLPLLNYLPDTLFVADAASKAEAKADDVAVAQQNAQQALEVLQPLVLFFEKYLVPLCIYHFRFFAALMFFI